jgi:tetratricopeptide (TPR) repeat protein
MFSLSIAFSAQTIQEHFEWGEYGTLIDLLEPSLDSLSKVSDSIIISEYHSYLGVAYFSIEKIGDARNHFFKAITYNPNISLPPDYVTPEIMDLFTVVKSDFENQKRSLFIQDSLLIMQQHEYERNIKKAALITIENKKRNSVILSVSTSALGAALIGAGVYQYYSTKSQYLEFKQAAADGDKVRYDRLRPDIHSANALLLTFDIASGAAFITSFFSLVKTLRLNKQLSMQQ